MKVLIAGATGVLGTPLARQLLEDGHEVLGVTRTPGNADRLIAMGARPIVADVMDRDGLLHAVRGLRADAVVHALTALKKTPMRHRDMVQTDALRDAGMANLLAVARAIGARRMVVESMHVGYGYGDWGGQVLTEEMPFAPKGRTRGLERHLEAFRALEDQLWDATNAGWIEGVSLRFGAFYAPDAGMRSMIDLLRKRRLPLVDGGHAVMSWVYYEDAAAATVAALLRGKPGQAYNIVDDEPVTWRDFLGLLATTAGTPPPRSMPRWLVSLAAPNGAAFLTSMLRASNARARRELGWTPTIPTYRQGIPRVVEALDAARHTSTVASSERHAMRGAGDPLPPRRA
jgi:nucleoside-diphosphate-sugar epimerase